MCVCVYVCANVCMYVCLYVCMYVCIYVCIYVYMHVMYVCMYWVVEGSLASLAPDCQTGQIEFANLAERWCRQSGDGFCDLSKSGIFTVCLLGFADVMICIDLERFARLKQLPDCPIGAFARLAILNGLPDWLDC